MRVFIILSTLVFGLFLQAAFTISAQDATSNSSAQIEEYLLGSRDLIEIRVFEHPELSIQARVETDKSVLLPVVGKAYVGSMSEQDAAMVIEAAYEAGGVVRNAAVTVRVIEFASQRVAVLGYINSPGQYTLDRPSRISDLLAMSGGPRSDGSSSLIFTDYDPDTGTSQRTKLIIDEILGLAGEDLNPKVGQGDIIYVPKAEVFYIYGEVNGPGVYQIDTPITIEQAIVLAGGTTELGKASSIRRRTSDGKMEKIDLSEMVRPGDIFQIPQRLF